ncbi:phage head closure protein [soil metagenome]
MASSCKTLSLRHRLTIQTLSKVSDGQGGYAETWSDGQTVWASIEPLKGYERLQAMQMQTPVTHKIVIRYREGVTTASRFLLGERIFWVKEVINESERNRFLNIKAIERA